MRGLQTDCLRRAELSEEFSRLYDGRVPENYAEFDEVIVRSMAKFEKGDESSTLVKIQRGLDEVKDVMRDDLSAFFLFFSSFFPFFFFQPFLPPFQTRFS